jgi:D-alanyl-D-alanine carboxypeptidase
MAVKNGKIPTSSLVQTSDGEYLIAHAAASYQRMNAEFAVAFGKHLGITSGYRTYAKQVELFKRLGYPRANYPGRSNHGFGIAADFGSGVAVYGSAEHRWMDTVGRRHGWIPLWQSVGLKRNTFEPWHWVHVPSRDRYPFRKVAVTGAWDIATVYALQRVLKRPVTSATSDAGKVALWKSIQRRLNAKLAGVKGYKPLTVDGDPGPRTIRALQTYLRRLVVIGRPQVDGIDGPHTFKALQRALNARKF